MKSMTFGRNPEDYNAQLRPKNGASGGYAILIPEQQRGMGARLFSKRSWGLREIGDF